MDPIDHIRDVIENHERIGLGVVSIRHARTLLDEHLSLRTSVRHMAEDNSPHDAQAVAERLTDEWDGLV